MLAIKRAAGGTYPVDDVPVFARGATVVSGVEWGGRRAEAGPIPPRMGEIAGRLAEIAISLLVLLFLSPSLLVIALVMAALDPGPLLSVERRIGRGGQPFGCLKFRTTTPRLDQRFQALLATSRSARAELVRTGQLRDDPRLTGLGRFLRASGLDEAPQFINVIRGEMSLVGPSPISAEAVALFGRRFRAYASVRPGVAGLWQLNGRPDLPFRRRIAMDVLYARRKSLSFDLQIVLATIPALLLRKEP